MSVFSADIPARTHCRGDSQHIDGHDLFCRHKPFPPPATLVLAQRAQIQKGADGGAQVLYSMYGFAAFDLHTHGHLGSSLGIPYNIASGQGVDITAEECGSTIIPMETSGLTRFVI